MSQPGHKALSGATRAVALGLALAAASGVSFMQDRRYVNAGLPADVPYSSAVVAGGFVFVSAVTGVEADGKLGPTIDAQTRRTIERLGASLTAAGSSLGQVVSVQVYLRNASDFQAMNEAYRSLFADKPPVRTTVVTDLAGGALISMAAIAVPQGAPREVLHPAGWMKSPRPYSYIVRAGGLVFLSGLVSRRGTDDTVVPGPVSTQTRTILDNAGILLKTAGVDYDDVVAARVFLTDDSYFEAMNDEYRTYFSNEPPARATAVTGLMGLESTVEITLIATTGSKEVLGAPVSPSLPLSSAVRTGDVVFLSGVLGNTDANSSDVAGQTRETLTRIGRTLDGAGLSFKHVVDATVYLPDLWHQPKVDAIYREFFSGEFPARTSVGARLVARTGLIEIMVTATGR
jgi:2-iminobutanoate/2-iminopropanoate deaminase